MLQKFGFSEELGLWNFVISCNEKTLTCTCTQSAQIQLRVLTCYFVIYICFFIRNTFCSWCHNAVWVQYCDSGCGCSYCTVGCSCNILESSCLIKSLGIVLACCQALWKLSKLVLILTCCSMTKRDMRLFMQKNLKDIRSYLGKSTLIAKFNKKLN